MCSVKGMNCRIGSREVYESDQTEAIYDAGTTKDLRKAL
jgi:hypothetical protein